MLVGVPTEVKDTQIGAIFLEAHDGGRGVLLGGVAGVRPARLVSGGGNVGSNAVGEALGRPADDPLVRLPGRA